MRKYIFTTLIALLANKFIFSQTIATTDISNKPYQFQAGINVTSFVRQFVNFSGSNNNIATSPYTLSFKAFKMLRNKNSQIGLRLGSGYTNENFSNVNATNSNSTFDESLDLRIGIEYQKMITKKWIAFVGFDYISQKETVNTESKFISSGTEFLSTNNRTTLMDGAGFIFGMQFNLNKFLALSTEASYYYSDSWTRNATFSSNSNNNQPPSNSKNTSTNLILPNVLNFTILF